MRLGSYLKLSDSGTDLKTEIERRTKWIECKGREWSLWKKAQADVEC